MIKTVLLDLDNTLLGNNMQDFLPPYFSALVARLSPFMAAGQDLRQIMYASVQKMQANQDPTVTNMAAFMADFVEFIDLPLAELEAILDIFYQEDYPEIQKYTTFRPEAPPIVALLIEASIQVVVATNPLFPMTALEQRLVWAGVRDFPYTLITAMENSHFAKPNPRYYQEILHKTDSQADTTWMVGDDIQNDIEPAHAVGLKTWWITDHPEQHPEVACDKRGSLADFLTWLEQGGLCSG